MWILMALHSFQLWEWDHEKFSAPRFQAQNYTKLHKVATDKDEATTVFQSLSLLDNICYKLETPKRSPICVYVSVCNVSCECVWVCCQCCLDTTTRESPTLFWVQPLHSILQDTGMPRCKPCIETSFLLPSNKLSSFLVNQYGQNFFVETILPCLKWQQISQIAQWQWQCKIMNVHFQPLVSKWSAVKVFWSRRTIQLNI